MNDEALAVLKEIRDAQKEALRLIQANHDLAREQAELAKRRIEESVGLQRLALDRQKAVAWVAVPAILVCIGAIAFLILRYLR